MKLLTRLFNNNKPKHNDNTSHLILKYKPTQDVNELLKLLDRFIESYEIDKGLKPERILVRQEIHKLFTSAGVYSAKRFGDILVIPATKMKENCDWQAI